MDTTETVTLAEGVTNPPALRVVAGQQRTSKPALALDNDFKIWVMFGDDAPRAEMVLEPSELFGFGRGSFIKRKRATENGNKVLSLAMQLNGFGAVVLCFVNLVVQ